MKIKYYRVSVGNVSEKLRNILGRISKVKIAVLFGSVLRREVVRDIDVGVVADPEFSLKELIRLSSTIEDELGAPVDLVPLRSAPPKLRLKALASGRRLIVRDSKLYAFLLSEALSESMDIDLKLKYMYTKSF
mgnify:CR=1 FL=1